MKRKPWIILATMAVGLLVIAGSVSAHHAGANYDRTHVITLSGTVTEYHFINPHVQIYFEVKDAQGSIAKWVAVADPPQRLYKRGWTKTSLKPGDQITVNGGPRKDGTPEIDIYRVEELVVNGKKPFAGRAE